MVAERQESVRGQGTRAGARTCSARGNPKRIGDQDRPRNRHTPLHPNTSADALPFTQQRKENSLCPVNTHSSLQLQDLANTPASAFFLLRQEVDGPPSG